MNELRRDCQYWLEHVNPIQKMGGPNLVRIELLLETTYSVSVLGVAVLVAAVPVDVHVDVDVDVDADVDVNVDVGFDVDLYVNVTWMFVLALMFYGCADVYVDYQVDV